MLRQEVKTWDRGNSSNCSDYLDLEFLNNHSELSSKIKVSVRLTATKTRETTTSSRNNSFCSDLTRLFGCWNIRWELCLCLRRPSWRRKHQKLWPQKFQNLITFKCLLNIEKKGDNIFAIFRLSFILRWFDFDPGNL